MAKGVDKNNANKTGGHKAHPYTEMIRRGGLYAHPFFNTRTP